MPTARGQPEWGMHLADDLERLAALHDGGNIAAVIVEPVFRISRHFATPGGLPGTLARDL